MSIAESQHATPLERARTTATTTATTTGGRDTVTVRSAATPAGDIVVVRGRVVPGDQRGRLLGFPTANLPLDEPAARGGQPASPASGITDGVFAGVVIDETTGTRHLAAVSIGRRTSFYGRDGIRLLEAHLVDFSGDLYGHEIVVELHAKLRPQRRYREVEALIEQLDLDVAAARTWAAERGGRTELGERTERAA